MEKYTKYFEQYDIFVNVMESVRNNFKRVQQLAVYDSGITAADVEKVKQINNFNKLIIVT